MMEVEKVYTMDELFTLLVMAEQQGYPLGRESYIESLTIKQLDNLLRKQECDA